MDSQFSSLHPDDITPLLLDAINSLTLSRKDEGKRIFAHATNIKLLGDIQYPYVCYLVPDQADNACKLTSPSDLPVEIRDIYLIDPGPDNLYATQSTLLVGVQACVYSKNGNSGTATVSGMSALRFNTTRPATPSSQHNFGKAFDVKLQGRMKSNGASYDQLACAYLCLYCVEAGATKVLFSDQAVVDAVNQATGKTVCSNISGHENHIHMDCR
jgi:hypothetical protein